MFDQLLADFRKDFQEARRFIALIQKYQALGTTDNSRKFHAACKAKDYENARNLYVQAAREASV